MARLNHNRATLLGGCGTMALALSITLAPERVRAQAFQANPMVVEGSVTFDRATPGQETITVDSLVSVIDWVPQEDASGNALTFLPINNIATFDNEADLGDFAVLNRVLPSTNNTITTFAGEVRSLLNNSSGTTAAGGRIAFYSPSGILVTGTASFDVGSLLLTTLEPTNTSFADFFNGNGPLIMTGATGTTARIEIQDLARITATLTPPP